MQAKEALNSNAPTGSSRDAFLLPDSGIRRCTAHMSNKLTGTFSQKIHRHPIVVVMSPPRSGALVMTIPIVVPQNAHALARAGSLGKQWPMLASADVRSKAAPTPLKARATSRSNKTEQLHTQPMPRRKLSDQSEAFVFYRTCRPGFLQATKELRSSVGTRLQPIQYR